MEFKAEKVGNEFIVKPIIEKVGGDVTIHVPSFGVIEAKLREIGQSKMEGETKVVKAK